MKISHRITIAAAGAAGACAIAIPAAMALSGTPSFSQNIPVRVPTSAHVISFDDHGKAIETDNHRSSKSASPTVTPSTSATSDDRGHRSTSPTSVSTPSATHSEPGDDNATHAEPGDDRGRHSTTPTTATTEPGDDNATHAEPGDDRGRHSTTPTKPTAVKTTTKATTRATKATAEPGDDNGGSRGGHAADDTRHGDDSGHVSGS